MYKEKQKKILSVVTPVYNEESNIEELFSRIDKAFLNTNQKYELLFVDNGSEFITEISNVISNNPAE